MLERGNFTNCVIASQDQELEIVHHFIYLGSVIDREGERSEEIMERVMQERQVMGLLNKSMKALTASIDDVKELHRIYVAPTVAYGSGTRTWNRDQISQLRVMEIR